jgi:hypothetical protein
MPSLKKRLVLAGATLTTVGAVTTLIAGFTFGLFSASETSGTNTFTAGTVSVGLGTPASVVCTVTLMPGDSSGTAPIGSKADTACTYNVEYTGTVGAWLGVDMTVTNGSTPLFTSGSENGVQFYLKDATPTTYVTSTAPTGGTTYNTEGGVATALPATGIADLLVSKTAATPSQLVNFTLDYALPSNVTSALNGGSVTVTLTFHAVQSANNALPTDCLAGNQCLSDGDGSTFMWS